MGEAERIETIEAEIVETDAEPMIKPKHPGGRPLLFKTPEELEERIEEYFDRCDRRKAYQTTKAGDVVEVPAPRPYTISGLAEALGMTRQTLLNYEDRDQFFDAIARARAKCGTYAEEQLFEGNDRGAKFALMNNYGWVESQQLDIHTTGQIELAPANLDELKAELVRLAVDAQRKGLLAEGNG
jgi:hypothetical protein